MALYRTTLGFRDDLGWQVIELCQSVFQLDEREAVISPPYQCLLTLLSKNIVSVADFGMVLTSTTVGSAAESSEVTAVDATMTAATSDGAEHALGGAQERLSPTSSVWQPYSEAQPHIQGEELAAIDVEADRFEIGRLQQMGVITTVDKYSGDLDTPLCAKMVRTWRKKQREEKDENGQVVSTTAWVRRSRLVGRDFNFLEYREDVYSPASSAAVVKVLPAMAIPDSMMENSALATLDVADAFLHVPQRVPRKISLDGSEYIILKCLPGQRDTSRLWYAFFIERLRAHMDISICPEQPCILKCGDKGSLMYLFMCVLQWISIYEIHFGSRGYSFGIA